jgi:hypothetical protein
MRDADAVLGERRYVVARQVNAVSAPDIPVEPTHFPEVLHGSAPVELLAVRLLLMRLGEVRVEPHSEPASQRSGLHHQLPRDRER